jgi:sulfur carrier protein ThiS
MEKAKLSYHNQQWEIEGGVTVRAALQQVGLDPNNVLALRQKKILNDRAVIEPGDEIKIVNVITGG